MKSPIKKSSIKMSSSAKFAATNSRYKQHRKPNRTTGVIVSAVSLVAIIAIAVPWVDEYFDLIRDTAAVSDMQDEIERVRQRQVALERIETKLDSELNPFLEHNVTADQVESVREALIETVRSSKALLRQLEIVSAEPRAWMADDDARNSSASLYGLDTRFVLHAHSIELQADGSLDAIKKVIEGVQRQRWLLITKSMSIAPTTTKEMPVTMELRLTVFGLEPAKETETDDDEFAIGDVASDDRREPLR